MEAARLQAEREEEETRMALKKVSFPRQGCGHVVFAKSRLTS